MFELQQDQSDGGSTRGERGGRGKSRSPGGVRHLLSSELSSARLRSSKSTSLLSQVNGLTTGLLRELERSTCPDVLCLILFDFVEPVLQHLKVESKDLRARVCVCEGLVRGAQGMGEEGCRAFGDGGFEELVPVTSSVEEKEILGSRSTEASSSSSGSRSTEASSSSSDGDGGDQENI